MVIEAIKLAVDAYDVRIVIVDNITYLRTETEKAKDALPLMRKLKELKTANNLSLLILAHTPKRDNTKPITRNDLQGSSMIINFCDSAFCIGESNQGQNVRYIKQIKCRSTEMVYTGDEVLTYTIEKRTDFLKFLLADVHGVHTSEREHLKQLSQEEWQSKRDLCIEFNTKGLTQREIAERLSVSVGVVNKWIKNTI